MDALYKRVSHTWRVTLGWGLYNRAQAAIGRREVLYGIQKDYKKVSATQAFSDRLAGSFRYQPHCRVDRYILNDLMDKADLRTLPSHNPELYNRQLNQIIAAVDWIAQ